MIDPDPAQVFSSPSTARARLSWKLQAVAEELKPEAAWVSIFIDGVLLNNSVTFRFLFFSSRRVRRGARYEDEVDGQTLLLDIVC